MDKQTIPEQELRPNRKYLITKPTDMAGEKQRVIDGIALYIKNGGKVTMAVSIPNRELVFNNEGIAGKKRRLARQRKTKE